MDVVSQKSKKLSIADVEPTSPVPCAEADAWRGSGSTNFERFERIAACLDQGRSSRAVGRLAEIGGLGIAILHQKGEDCHQHCHSGSRWRWVARECLEESMEQGGKSVSGDHR